eukprot:g4542.t1
MARNILLGLGLCFSLAVVSARTVAQCKEQACLSKCQALAGFPSDAGDMCKGHMYEYPRPKIWRACQDGVKMGKIRGCLNACSLTDSSFEWGMFGHRTVGCKKYKAQIGRAHLDSCNDGYAKAVARASTGLAAELAASAFLTACDEVGHSHL